MTNNTSHPERLSNDALENLCLENEALRTKYQAQYGNLPRPSNDITPEMENVILRSLLEIEELLPYMTTKKIYEIIGCPAFKKADQLDDTAIARELKRMEKLMKQNHIRLRFIAPQDDRLKYQFITEVFFDRKLEVNTKLPPDKIYSFTYEDFLPDNESQIRARTDNFFCGVFGIKMNFIALLVSDKLVDPRGHIFPATEVIDRLEQKLTAYKRFKKVAYKVNDIFWEFTEAPFDSEARGFSEGNLKYTTDEEGNFEGSFKIYFALKDGFWSIYYFEVSGWHIF